MGNYTPEEIEKALDFAKSIRTGGWWPLWVVETLAAASSAYAATLRQQAGRVDEGFDLRKWVRHMTQVLEAGKDVLGVDADLARLGAAIQAALAQNTQGEDSPLRSIMDNNAWRAAMVGLCSPTREADVSTPDLAADHLRKRLHAERARVPEADAARFRYIVERNWIGTKTRCAERIQDSDLESARRAVDRALAAAPSQRAEVK